MKDVKLYMALLLATFVVSGCTPSTQTEKFPPDTNTTKNCAADGVGCKQFNENLRK